MSDHDGDRIVDALRHDAATASPQPIDVDAVLTRSRAARRHRRRAIVGGSVTAVALVAVVGLAIGPPLGFGGATMSDAPASHESTGEISTDASGGALPESDVAPQDEPDTDDPALAPLAQAVTCGDPVVAPASVEGLTLEIVSATIGADGTGEVAARLSGTSTRSVRFAGSPTATIAADGATVWTAAVAADGEVELGPNSTRTIRIPFDARDCRADGDALAPGAFDAVAAVELRVDGGTVRLVSVPAPVVWAEG